MTTLGTYITRGAKFEIQGYQYHDNCQPVILTGIGINMYSSKAGKSSVKYSLSIFQINFFLLLSHNPFTLYPYNYFPFSVYTTNLTHFPTVFSQNYCKSLFFSQHSSPSILVQFLLLLDKGTKAKMIKID